MILMVTHMCCFLWVGVGVAVLDSCHSLKCLALEWYGSVDLPGKVLLCSSFFCFRVGMACSIGRLGLGWP